MNSLFMLDDEITVNNLSN